MVNSSTNSNSDLVNVKISDLVSKFDLVVKGSESFIYASSFLSHETLIKERKAKKYRNPHLDSELRFQRLRIESRMIKLALQNSIAVPIIYSVDISTFSMQLEYIKGQNLGQFLFEDTSRSDVTHKRKFFEEFGLIVSKLHNISIIHGDLTPMNILISRTNSIRIIDFGLSFISDEVKDKAMDLFILFGSLKIFAQQNEDLFDMFLQGYQRVDNYKPIIDIFNKLTNKGRYK